jgi:predicted esterase YcpF (UPF0227 family)
MNKKEIEKSDKGRLVELRGSSILLVSFGGIRQGLGVPVFEFFNSISYIECDKIFLRDFNQSWYQKGVDSELNHVDKVLNYLRKIIDKNEYKNICFLGNSMGGYASILFGTILNVDTVISFAPQTFINRINRFMKKDKRWSHEINLIYNYDLKRKEYFDLKKYLKKNNAYKTKINIYYSSSHTLDSKHSERLLHVKGVNLIPFEKGGHSVVKTLRDNGQLKALLESVLK